MTNSTVLIADMAILVGNFAQDDSSQGMQSFGAGSISGCQLEVFDR